MDSFPMTLEGPTTWSQGMERSLEPDSSAYEMESSPNKLAQEDLCQQYLFQFPLLLMTQTIQLMI